MSTSIKDKALTRLVLAQKDMALADLLLPQPGVVHAYAAIDNILSALVWLHDEKPAKDHGKKISRFRFHYPDADTLIPRSKRLEKFLDKSHAVRYRNADCSISEFTEIAHASEDFFELGIKEVSRVTGDSADTIRDSIRSKAAHERSEAWRDAVGQDQENRFQYIQNEYPGRRGFTTAATDLSNFIALNIDTDAASVRRLLKGQPAVAAAIVELKEKFRLLVQCVQGWNAEEITRGAETPRTPGEKVTDEEVDGYMKTLVTSGSDFRLVALLSFRGTDLIEHMKQVWASLAEAKKK